MCKVPFKKKISKKPTRDWAGGWEGKWPGNCPGQRYLVLSSVSFLFFVGFHLNWELYNFSEGGRSAGLRRWEPTRGVVKTTSRFSVLSSWLRGRCAAPWHWQLCQSSCGCRRSSSRLVSSRSSECIIVSHPLIIRKFIAALGKCHFTAVAWNKSVFCSELAPSAHLSESLAKEATGFIYAHAY